MSLVLNLFFKTFFPEKIDLLGRVDHPEVLFLEDPLRRIIWRFAESILFIGYVFEQIFFEIRAILGYVDVRALSNDQTFGD